MQSAADEHDELVAASEIKGFVFATLKRYVTDEFSGADFQRLLSRLPADARSTFEDPEVSSMYPEAHMHAFVVRLYHDLAEEDSERFAQMIRGIAQLGISRFFRIILSLTSALFVVRRVPLLFKRLRSGPAELETVEEEERLIIHYRKFPWCGDPIYRVTSMANIQAAVEATGGKRPRIVVLECSSSSMSLGIELDKEAGRLSAVPVH